MPFRAHPLGPRLSRWLLPGFVAIGLLLIAVWCAWTISVLPGGFHHLTPGQVLFIAGFAGICVFSIFGTAVIVAVVESALAETRAEMLRQFVLLARAHIEYPPQETKEE